MKKDAKALTKNTVVDSEMDYGDLEEELAHNEEKEEDDDDDLLATCMVADD